MTLEEGHHLAAPKHWRRESISSNTEISAVFVMKHCEKKMKDLEATLYDLSTPTSKNYGKWLSKEQVVERYLAADEKNIDLVLTFLAQAGVKNIRVSDLKDKIFVKMPVKIAEEVLQTKFALYRSHDRPHVALPRITKAYSLPAEIARHVALVDDIMRFPTVAEPLSAPLGDAPEGSTAFQCGTSCAASTTPTVISQAYNLPMPMTTTASKGNSVSVAEFQGQYYDQGDISNFDSACSANAEVDATIGGNAGSAGCSAGQCMEALLDIEYLGAMTNPIPLTVVYTNQYSLQTWIDTVLALDNPPWVHSVSYGNDEIQQTSVAYMNTCNAAFMAAGTMGLSILFASGDQGVWGRDGIGPRFHPDFPGDSPFITTVGGTNFVQKSTVGEEAAWNCGGGGFSNVFAQPSFQADVVNAYLANPASNLPAASNFNATGRAYPDVSALGGQTNPYCVSNGGSLTGVWGTSAACPVVASVFTQLNNLRFAAGKPSLGWLNPFIYANTDCFNDVKQGQNNCIKGTQGFEAVSGWDAATGNGTPNYTCLAERI